MSFAISYAWAATQMPWLPALLISLSAYLVVGIALVLSAPPFALIVVMLVVAVVLAPRVFPRLTQPIGPAASSSIELCARMVAGGVLTSLGHPSVAGAWAKVQRAVCRVSRHGYRPGRLFAPCKRQYLHHPSASQYGFRLLCIHRLLPDYYACSACDWYCRRIYSGAVFFTGSALLHALVHAANPTTRPGLIAGAGRRRIPGSSPCRTGCGPAPLRTIPMRRATSTGARVDRFQNPFTPSFARANVFVAEDPGWQKRLSRVGNATRRLWDITQRDRTTESQAHPIARRRLCLIRRKR